MIWSKTEWNSLYNKMYNLVLWNYFLIKNINTVIFIRCNYKISIFVAPFYSTYLLFRKNVPIQFYRIASSWDLHRAHYFIIFLFVVKYIVISLPPTTLRKHCIFQPAFGCCALQALVKKYFLKFLAWKCRNGMLCHSFGPLGDVWVGSV